jgi:hypothetical protein
LTRAVSRSSCQYLCACTSKASKASKAVSTDVELEIASDEGALEFAPIVADNIYTQV